MNSRHGWRVRARRHKPVSCGYSNVRARRCRAAPPCRAAVPRRRAAPPCRVVVPRRRAAPPCRAALPRRRAPPDPRSPIPAVPHGSKGTGEPCPYAVPLSVAAIAGAFQVQFQQTRQDRFVAQIHRPAVGGHHRFVEGAVRVVKPCGTLVIEVRQRALL